MRRFFSSWRTDGDTSDRSLVARRQRGGSPVEEEAGSRLSAGSEPVSPRSGHASPELDIVIEAGRDIVPKGCGRAEVGHSGFGLLSGDGRVAMVGSGNFGLMACSQHDFMQLGVSVMDALTRAEAFKDDDDFADAILEEVLARHSYVCVDGRSDRVGVYLCERH